jgi:hypothetical protein
MNLYIMPMGIDGGSPRLGSIDFMAASELPTQVSLDNSQAEVIKTGAASSAVAKAVVPDLDLCVMNPPFVRSVGGNLLFGSLPDDRGLLQKELKQLVKSAARRGYPASITAGLGSVFVALADMRLKQGGRLAFVLPAALASGEAWAETRKLISARYHLELVVASHDAERHNFSENTDLSELLFVARKLADRDPPGRTTYINLWRNPRSIHEALDLADRVRQTRPAEIERAGFASISGDAAKLGEVVSMPAPSGAGNWRGALFAQTELLRSYCALEESELRIPGSASTRLALCPLSDVGSLGYDRRDIHDAFTVSADDWSPYPAFWDHIAEKTVSIRQAPNRRLIARSEAAKGRKLKDAAQVWSGAGRILLVERLWPITHRVLGLRFDEEVLGNTWWALKTGLSAEQEKALLLWLNSSLALLLVFGRRVATRSAWMQMKKPAWESMPVLDVRNLIQSQTRRLSAIFDSVASQELRALAKLDADPIRQQIDDALSVTLDLPDLSAIRALLAREPGLAAVAMANRVTQDELFEDDEQSEQTSLI